MNQFELKARDIFKAADVDPEAEPILFRNCINILSECMATLSVRYGLSMKRASAYQEQIDTLINDLKTMKENEELK